ncbi:MAG: cytochrome c [Hyphomicrobiaceae bacterium]
MHALIRLAVIGSSLGASLGGTLASAAAEGKPSIDEGRALLETNCSSCHATAKTGASPLAKAPQFRTLKQKYPLENLGEALAEGIMTGHPAMPQFVFNPAQIESILSYLDSISEP